VRKVHGALVWLIVVFARDIIQHREAASDDGAAGASQGKKIGLGNPGVKVVRREWAAPNQNVNLMSILLELHRFSTAKGKLTRRAKR
jgi:hypothetical protein